MNGSLYLTPINSESQFKDTQKLIAALLQLEFIGEPHQENYLCGNKFTQLVTFMGCSPHLLFEPPHNGHDAFCHIQIHHFKQIKILTGRQTAPPRCPHCRARVIEWKEALQQSQNHCKKCGLKNKIHQLDWRQSGGAGSIFIEIKNIFPGEAVPVEKLLNEIEKISHEKWRYFYLV